jgi:hypothetical protein
MDRVIFENWFHSSYAAHNKIIPASVKRHSWTDLRTLPSAFDNITAFWKKFAVLDALYSIFWALSSMNPLTVVWLWRKLLLGLKDGDLPGFPNEISKSKFLT